MPGKVALVAGGASGIGRSTALTFAREGANVVVADISVTGGEETAHLVEKAGVKALFVKADVTKRDEIEGMVTATVQQFGRLDAALNNVGHPGHFKDAVETTEEEWNYIANIDLRTIWLSMKYQIPAMRLSGEGGAIVNTATAAVFRVVPRMAAFTAFKHGIVGITQSVAKDFAIENIRANVLAPGATATPMFLGSLKDLGTTEEAASANNPMKRLGRPEEQAEAAVWLCSPRASYVTGIVLRVDGGQML
ncbi:MAG: SDR family oxidoreductase [Caulobacterales bacterium]